ncbi:MAG TPA: VOC family protein [Ignavibacteria bacterium]|nr:VOC family protein [Ignavibacteria bacterium]HMR41644.1 VOC family protein [Ignavibacteria bacterium]
MISPGHTEIFVSDPERSKEFYEKVLGFELVEIQNDKFIWLKLGTCLYLLRPGENKLIAENYKDSNTGFVLYTADLEKTKQELISRGLKFSGTDGSDRCLTFKDPDGNWFQLVNPDHH